MGEPNKKYGSVLRLERKRHNGKFCWNKQCLLFAVEYICYRMFSACFAELFSLYYNTWLKYSEKIAFMMSMTRAQNGPGQVLYCSTWDYKYNVVQTPQPLLTQLLQRPEKAGHNIAEVTGSSFTTQYLDLFTAVTLIEHKQIFQSQFHIMKQQCMEEPA